MSEIPKTWNVLVRKFGGHWDATVRHGVEESRVRNGSLVFDQSEFDEIGDAVRQISDHLVTKTMNEVGGVLSDDQIRDRIYLEMKDMILSRFGVMITFPGVV